LTVRAAACGTVVALVVVVVARVVDGFTAATSWARSLRKPSEAASNVTAAKPTRKALRPPALRNIGPKSRLVRLMGTLVCFHAHPDDEAIGTGGTIAKTVKAGHRVVLVTATRGEHGEYPEDFLAPGESLRERREQEMADAVEVLGIARHEFLGYVDSGMMGTPENEAPESFWQADTEEAAQRLAAILEEEQADVLTVYDENGIYGHPDHIKVWQVGVRAAELARTPKVYEATVNRTAWRRRAAQGEVPVRTVETVDGVDTLRDVPEGEARTIEFPLGVEEDQITTAIDVRDFVAKKKEAMRAHKSQITEESFFMKMPDDVFAEGFGTEWFILRGAPAGIHEDDLFTGL
jgi:LmbE family N-acetylglucosaminyl deacetylase